MLTLGSLIVDLFLLDLGSVSAFEVDIQLAIVNFAFLAFLDLLALLALGHCVDVNGVFRQASRSNLCPLSRRFC